MEYKSKLRRRVYLQKFDSDCVHDNMQVFALWRLSTSVALGMCFEGQKIRPLITSSSRRLINHYRDFLV
jgi:hypothetical protein